MKFKFNRKEFWASFLMLFIGIATIIGSQNYQMGSLIRMGPGYFPLMLGILLTAIAVLILFSPEALTDDGDTDDGVVLTMREQVTTWALVVGSVILFIIIGKYGDRKSTRLNCSHVAISYAVFCLKKKRVDVGHGGSVGGQQLTIEDGGEDTGEVTLRRV